MSSVPALFSLDPSGKRICAATDGKQQINANGVNDCNCVCTLCRCSLPPITDQDPGSVYLSLQGRQGSWGSMGLDGDFIRASCTKWNFYGADAGENSQYDGIIPVQRVCGSCRTCWPAFSYTGWIQIVPPQNGDDGTNGENCVPYLVLYFRCGAADEPVSSTLYGAPVPIIAVYRWYQQGPWTKSASGLGYLPIGWYQLMPYTAPNPGLGVQTTNLDEEFLTLLDETSAGAWHEETLSELICWTGAFPSELFVSAGQGNYIGDPDAACVAVPCGGSGATDQFCPCYDGSTTPTPPPSNPTPPTGICAECNSTYTGTLGGSGSPISHPFAGGGGGCESPAEGDVGCEWTDVQEPGAFMGSIYFFCAPGGVAQGQGWYWTGLVVDGGGPYYAGEGYQQACPAGLVFTDDTGNTLTMS